MSNSGAVVEIRTLVDAMRTDRFTAEQTARLDELVCTDDDACWAYVQQRHQDAVLRMALARQIPHLAQPASLASSPTSEALPTAIAPRRLWRRLSSRMAEPGAVSLIAATVAVGLALVVLAAFAVPTFRGRDVQRAAVSATASSVARLTRTFNVNWTAGTHPLAVGATIAKGERVELAAGLIEIEFDKGTRVVVEGPAALSLDGRNGGLLSRGKLVAQVPPAAIGFTLHTPTATLTDLGTEFGVLVDDTGATEVHVFQGMVEAQFANTTTEPQTGILTAGESARIDATTRQLQVTTGHTKSLAQRFIRSVPNTLKRGVTKDLVVANPSFEVPDIRKHPKYRECCGNLRRVPLGWRAPPMPNEYSEQRRVLYQRSPYRESAESTLGPGATDGEQVALVWLRKPGGGSDDDISETWLYQSLGIVTADDVGKTLHLSADVTARTQLQGKTPMDDGATAETAFAVDVSDRGAGNAVGTPGQVPSLRRDHGVRTLQAALTIGPELIDRELSIRLTVAIPEPVRDASCYGQYHFDNVRCVVEGQTSSGRNGPHHPVDASKNRE